MRLLEIINRLDERNPEDGLKAIRALRTAVTAMQCECKPFNFPEEDRTTIHGGLVDIRTILQDI